ncbi:hypothetical protein PFISCL1PPCAC_26104, partial [Pristionchus fissidentatus]
SCPTCTEADQFVVPNLAYAASAYIASHNDVHTFIQTLLDLATLITGSSPVHTVEAGEFIFESFHDPLIALQHSTLIKMILGLMNGTLFGVTLPNYPHAGL